MQHLREKQNKRGINSIKMAERSHICGLWCLFQEEYRDFSLEMGTLQQELGQKKSLEDLIAHFFSADTRELACEHCNDTDAVATVTIMAESQCCSCCYIFVMNLGHTIYLHAS